MTQLCIISFNAGSGAFRWWPGIDDILGVLGEIPTVAAVAERFPPGRARPWPGLGEKVPHDPAGLVPPGAVDGAQGGVGDKTDLGLRRAEAGAQRPFPKPREK